VQELPKNVWTTRQVSQALGVSVSVVGRQVARGQLVRTKVQGRDCFVTEDLFTGSMGEKLAANGYLLSSDGYNVIHVAPTAETDFLNLQLTSSA
jgi:hypothetical protein